MKLSLYLSAVILILCSISCKKYQDGPYLSFRSKNARLINTWNCVGALDYNSNPPSVVALFDRTLKLYEDGEFSMDYALIQNGVFIADSLSGTWSLEQNKEVIDFDCSLYFTSSSPYDSLFYMDILELRVDHIELLGPENTKFFFDSSN